MRAPALVVALSVLLAACAGGGQPTGQPTNSPGSQPTPGGPASPTAAATPDGSPDVGPSAVPTAGPPATPGTSPGVAPTATPAGLGSGPFEWRQLSLTDGPSAREDHTFTVERAAGTAYLFGGRAGDEAFGDLWRYDLADGTWQELAVDGFRPDPRFGHVAAWVDGVGVVMWSGQQSDDVFFDRIFAYHPFNEGWSLMPGEGDAPSARYGSCAAVGPDGRYWISHGFTADTGRFDDTRAYDFDALAWSDLTEQDTRPVTRCLHDCLWTPDGQFVVYGGQTTGAPAIGDLWSYDPASSAWTQAERPEAPPRQQYALAQAGGTAFVFGGGSSDGVLLDDLWLLDLDTLTMTRAEVTSAGPSARSGATLIADEASGRLLLFGGKDESGELADMWELVPAQP